jgi:hypothetical protein
MKAPVSLVSRWITARGMTYGVAAGMAIAPFSAIALLLTHPSWAQSTPAPSPTLAQTPSPTPAQTPVPTSKPSPTPKAAPMATPSFCRAVNRDTPLFSAASTTSATVRTLAKNSTVTLASMPPAGSQFAQVSAPAAGFVQTAVLKLCATVEQPAPPSVCRAVATTAPTAGIRVRKQPNTQADVLTAVFPKDKVYLTTVAGGGVKTSKGEDYIWVQVDLKKTFGQALGGVDYGWMFNLDLKASASRGNLVMCP